MPSETNENKRSFDEELEVQQQAEGIRIREPRDDGELRALARDVYSGKVFTDRQIGDGGDLTMCFPVLMLLDSAYRQAMQDRGVAMVYEEMHLAGPRSVNGYPMFFSFKWLDNEEFERFRVFFVEYKEMQDKFMGAPTGG